MAKSATIDPLLAGAIGVGIGAVLWGFVIAPASKDSLLWTGTEAEMQAIKDLLAKAGVDSSMQNMLGRFAILVRSSDLQKAVALISTAGYLK